MASRVLYDGTDASILQILAIQPSDSTRWARRDSGGLLVPTATRPMHVYPGDHVVRDEDGSLRIVRGGGRQ